VSDSREKETHVDDLRKTLAQEWVTGLTLAFEAMAGVQPEVEWKDSASAQAADLRSGALWFEQRFPVAEGASVWVGAPAATWETAGTFTLRAAGLETVDEAEARNTWLEILKQAFGALARVVGSRLNRDISLESAAEVGAPAYARDSSLGTLTFPGESPASFWLAISDAFVDSLVEPPQSHAGVEDRPEESEPDASSPSDHYPTLDLLLKVELPVSISFGKKSLPLREVLKLTTGSIVELDREVDEPVDILVNHCLIARGEVVVVEGNYGVRIREISTRQERLRSLQ
jgi:flagellar motor switch protein FliN